MPLTCPSSVLAVIPARYGSTRFPGKPLVEIAGKPMVAHVVERAKAAVGVHRVIVATDDERIADAVRAYGGEAIMTLPSHPSGSDRVWEVAESLPDYGWILNVQGDEPTIDPLHLEAAIALAQTRPEADVVTLVTPMGLPQMEADYQNPNVVKAVLGEKGRVLYFSRAPMPCYRDGFGVDAVAYRHVGLYLYQRQALQRFTQLPPSPLERAEKLEQLRGLEAGMAFYAAVVDNAPVGVDTPEDLARLNRSA